MPGGVSFLVQLWVIGCPLASRSSASELAASCPFVRGALVVRVVIRGLSKYEQR
jgi:hypothetical protein